MVGEIVLIMGPPAGGKTTLTESYVARGYARVNRDTMGPSAGTADLAPVIDQMAAQGQRTFVLDNLFKTRDRREAILAVGRKYGIPVIARVLDTTPEQAQFNAARRLVQRYGRLVSASEKKGHAQAKDDPNCFPPVVLSSYFKEFEPPTQAEGFTEVLPVHFGFDLGPGYTNRAVIFDYDSTLRRTEGGNGKFPTHPDQIRLMYPTVPAKLADLKARGFLLLGATSQSGVAKGDLTLGMAQECVAATNRLVGQDIDTELCPHPSGPPSCWCQKPLPGLGVVLIERYKLNPAACVYVGDMTKDRTFSQRCGFGFAYAEDFFR